MYMITILFRVKKRNEYFIFKLKAISYNLTNHRPWISVTCLYFEGDFVPLDQNFPIISHLQYRNIQAS